MQMIASIGRLNVNHQFQLSGHELKYMNLSGTTFFMRRDSGIF